jgi:hypothetical protein
MFGLPIIRHRHFELFGFRAEQPRHPHHFAGVNKGNPEITRKNKSKFIQVAGHGGDGYSFKIKAWQDAMGIDWIKNRKFLAEAVPPAYSRYIGKEFLRKNVKVSGT